jgi:hypothetical protein
MKKLIVLVALVGAGFLAWQKFSRESEAVKAYRDFAEAYAYNRLDQAKEMTVKGSSACRDIERKIDLHNKVGFAGMTYGITSMSFNVLDEQESEGGKTIKLKVQQTRRITGGGMESAMGHPVVDEHDVTLKADGASWKIASFAEREL